MEMREELVSQASFGKRDIGIDVDPVLTVVVLVRPVVVDRVMKALLKLCHRSCPFRNSCSGAAGLQGSAPVCWMLTGVCNRRSRGEPAHRKPAVLSDRSASKWNGNTRSSDPIDVVLHWEKGVDRIARAYRDGA